MKTIKLKTYTLRTENGWLGQIIISSDGMFSAVTDYGNLSYAWRSIGNEEDFRAFLSRLSVDYFASKLQNGLSYITYTKKSQDSCNLFAEKILPALKKVLEDDLINDKDWQA
jgi:hypothetical protein